MTLAALNALDRDRFVEALGWVFEHSPWVAERAWTRRPFADVEHLHRAMAAEVAAARPEEQLALLRSHPDLGIPTRLSVASAGEQESAGLHRLTARDGDDLRRLTAEYRDRFGFPFLLAVKGRTAADVIATLSARLSSSPADEHAEGLRQVYEIARLRLADMVR
jgi:2-oxo-4-hydroxy-4-carboxy-5-ureidoimidazoline decarboxylase